MREIVRVPARVVADRRHPAGRFAEGPAKGRATGRAKLTAQAAQSGKSAVVKKLFPQQTKLRFI